MENSIRISLVLVLALTAACASQNKFDKDYPTFTTERNSIEKLEHYNDSTLLIKQISDDLEYGYIESKPIMLGVYNCDNGADNRTKYFNALKGPNGEAISFKRIKSCCPFRTPNSQTVGADQKFGLLDVWEISYEGLKEPIIVYINLYDQGTSLAPIGFTIK